MAAAPRIVTALFLFLEIDALPDGVTGFSTVLAISARASVRARASSILQAPVVETCGYEKICALRVSKQFGPEDPCAEVAGVQQRNSINNFVNR